MAKLHVDLKEKVLHVEQQTITANLNDVEGRVDNQSSLRACEGLPPGQGGIEILAAMTMADVAVLDFIQFINRVVVLPVGQVCTAVTVLGPRCRARFVQRQVLV